MRPAAPGCRGPPGAQETCESSTCLDEIYAGVLSRTLAFFLFFDAWKSKFRSLRWNHEQEKRT